MQDVQKAPLRKLLMVDDEPSIRNSMAQVFNEIGYFVQLAQDGFSALVEIRKRISADSCKVYRQEDDRFSRLLCQFCVRRGGSRTVHQQVHVQIRTRLTAQWLGNVTDREQVRVRLHVVYVWQHTSRHRRC